VPLVEHTCIVGCIPATKYCQTPSKVWWYWSLFGFSLGWHPLKNPYQLHILKKPYQLRIWFFYPYPCSCGQEVPVGCRPISFELISSEINYTITIYELINISQWVIKSYIMQQTAQTGFKLHRLNEILVTNHTIKCRPMIDEHPYSASPLLLIP